MQRGPQAIGSLLSAVAVVLIAGSAAAQVPLAGGSAPEAATEAQAPVETTVAARGEPHDGATAAQPSAPDNVPAPAPPHVIESPAAAREELACEDRVCIPKDGVVVGTGYHPFRHFYLLIGLNSMWSPAHKSSIYELETSLPYVTGGLFYFGAWAAAGFRARMSHRNSDTEVLPYATLPKHAARLAAGAEMGWRIIAADIGYVHDAGTETPPVVARGNGGILRPRNGNGVRTRLGLAISDELFTSQFATYRRSCCKPRGGDADRARKFGYAVPCECERTPVGLSLFVYWAHQYFLGSSDYAGLHEDLFGVSLKLGVGL